MTFYCCIIYMRLLQSMTDKNINVYVTNQTWDELIDSTLLHII